MGPSLKRPTGKRGISKELFYMSENKLHHNGLDAHLHEGRGAVEAGRLDVLGSEKKRKERTGYPKGIQTCSMLWLLRVELLVFKSFSIMRCPLPEEVGSPDYGQVPHVHVGLGAIGCHMDQMPHQELQGPIRGGVEVGTQLRGAEFCTLT